MKIYIKKVDGLVIPKNGSDLSAGYDIVATSDPKTVGDGNNIGWHRIDFIECKFPYSCFSS